MASTVYKQFRQVAVSNTAVLINSGSCVLVGWNLINPNSANAYVKFYNNTLAEVNGGTGTIVKDLLIPGSGTSLLSNEDKFQLNFNIGMVIKCVTGIADADNTAPSIGCYVELLYDASPNN